MPCSREPRRRVPRPPLGASGNVSRNEWPGDGSETSPAQPHTTVPPSLPPRAWQCGLSRVRVPGTTCLPLPLLRRYSHSDALGPGSAAWKLSDTHGRRQPVAPGAQTGAGGAAARAPRSRCEGPEARGRSGLNPATPGGFPAPAAGSRWQSSAAPPACHCRRPSTRDRGRPSSGERAWQCAPEPPGVRLWRPRRAWTGRGRASRSQPPGVCPASVSQFCNLRARDLSRSWRSFWFYT